MTENLSRSLKVSLQDTFTGLENVTSCQVRILPSPTLFSIANRFLKPHFPPQRDYELLLDLVNRGLINPQFSRTHLRSIPLKTVEQLAQLVLQTALSSEERISPSPRQHQLDLVLTLVIAVEETWQYDLNALVSEDLALLESHQDSSLQSYFFKPSQNPNHIGYLMESLGYRIDLLTTANRLGFNLQLAYWLCRRLSVIFPWSAILNQFPADQAEVFPGLYRLQLVWHHLNESLPNPVDCSAESLLTVVLPQIEDWLKTVFPTFSQQARFPRPFQALVLAEGSTEAVLLPAIAAITGHNLDFEGIWVQPVGGKNQMLQQYVDYAEYLAVPISIVMDKDAQSLLPDLSYYKRQQDRIFILEEGEFEDLYTPESIVKTVNTYYHPNKPLTLKDLKQWDGTSRVKALQIVWQELGLGLFDKVEFAQHLAHILQNKQQYVSPQMSALIHNIIETKRHALSH